MFIVVDKMLGIDFGEEIIGVEMSNAEGVETFNVVEVVDGMRDDSKIGVFPCVDDGLIDPAPNHSNNFDAGFFGKSEDILWCPSIPDGIKCV